MRRVSLIHGCDPGGHGMVRWLVLDCSALCVRRRARAGSIIHHTFPQTFHPRPDARGTRACNVQLSEPSHFHDTCRIYVVSPFAAFDLQLASPGGRRV